MSNYLPNVSGNPVESWRSHLQSQSDLLSAVRSSNNIAIGSVVANYLVTRSQTNTLVASIGANTDRQIAGAQQNTRDIIFAQYAATSATISAIAQSTDILANSINTGTRIIAGAIGNFSVLMDCRLSIISDQLQISNVTQQNIAQLLRIPDFQKERQYYIEQGFKHYSNARIDSDLYESALDNLMKAEQLEKTDYVVLHRIGMIYLYAENLIDLDKAADYFERAGKFAIVEVSPDAIRIANILGTTSTPLSMAADSYTKRSLVEHLRGNQELSISLAEKAKSIDNKNTSARMQYIQCLLYSGENNKAAAELSDLLLCYPPTLIFISEDDRLMGVDSIRSACEQFSEDVEIQCVQFGEIIDRLFSFIKNKNGEIELRTVKNTCIQHFVTSTIDDLSSLKIEIIDFVYSVCKDFLISSSNDFGEVFCSDKSFIDRLALSANLYNEYFKENIENDRDHSLKSLEALDKIRKYISSSIWSKQNDPFLGKTNVFHNETYFSPLERAFIRKMIVSAAILRFDKDLIRAEGGFRSGVINSLRSAVNLIEESLNKCALIEEIESNRRAKEKERAAVEIEERRLKSLIESDDSSMRQIDICMSRMFQYLSDTKNGNLGILVNVKKEGSYLYTFMDQVSDKDKKNSVRDRIAAFCLTVMSEAENEYSVQSKKILFKNFSRLETLLDIADLFKNDGIKERVRNIRMKI